MVCGWKNSKQEASAETGWGGNCGPFEVEVDFDVFKQVYHGLNDRYMRRICLVGAVIFTVPGLTGWVELARGVVGLPTDIHDFRMFVAMLGLGLVWLCFVVGLVRPVFFFVTRPGEVFGFFRGLGADVDSVRRPGDERGLRVRVGSGCDECGVWLVLADGSRVCVPWWALDPHVAVTKGFVVVSVKDWKRDSPVWNMVGVNWMFRDGGSGLAMLVPRSDVSDVGGLVRSLSSRIRGARRWYKGVERMARRHPEEASALLQPTVDWLQANGQDRKTGDRDR